MQTIAAAAGSGVVERKAQIVPTEKPLKCPTRFRDPEHIVRGVIRLDAGGNRHLRLNGLLVKDGAFIAARKESVRTDRAKRTGIRSLDFCQPAQSFEAGLQHRCVVQAVSTENHRVWQLRVRIRNDFFKPVPLVGGGVVVALHEFRRERFADLVRAPVAAEPPQVFVNADERECPRARRRKFGGHGQRLFEELRREHLKTALTGLRHT